MKVNSGEYPFGCRVEAYAIDVLKKLDDKSIPVDLHGIADYLGISVEIIEKEPIDKFKTLHGKDLKESGIEGFFDLERSKILIFSSGNAKRDRMTLAHELGHATLPWHSSSLHSGNSKKNVIEEQAFACGREYLFPRDSFLQDMQELDVSINSIITLSEQYDASIEATGMRYAKLAKIPLAFLVIEKSNGKKKKIADSQDSNLLQRKFSLDIKEKPICGELENTGLLAVKYAACSNFMKKFEFRNGSKVQEDSIFYQGYSERKSQKKDKISFKKGGNIYSADIYPFGYNGQILALVWCSINQLEMEF